MMRKTILAAGVAVIGLGAIAVSAPTIAQAAAASQPVAGHHDRAAPGGRMAHGPETQQQATTRAAALFDRMDANKDGVLDTADRQARRAAMFDRLDKDKDGQIDRAEFSSHEMHSGRMGRGGHHRGMMGRMARGNGDGPTTRAEFLTASQQRFAQMDADDDGTVTVAERKAARERMRAMHREARSGDAG